MAVVTVLPEAPDAGLGVSRPADLGAGHITFKIVPLFPGILVPIGIGDVEPHVREYGILNDALAVGIHDSQDTAGACATLIGSETVPADGIGLAPQV